MLRHGSSLSAVRERRIEYELSYDRPTGAGAALPPFKNTLGHFGMLPIKQQRKQHTAFAVDGYAITASFADCKNAAALHHVKQILLSSFANNTAKNSSGDILAIPPEQRDNNSGGSPYVP